ncbi:glycosyl hydrolase family 28-related protein [Rhizosphaericola mali]|uniref:Rhamnogalacturonase A/B/Epimerase-like pectate lyase domain-containing protein n=1 Tax=Rhizosphaericola mali TaxID=2545455 RepID=A0A5P2FYX4_9BACT|nr:glycosyl hydrolase family 28-related protein [Rhizosphaericola mali]QES88405.1 hypothetical protein E0W69_006945 [Rhizosphaericola mali]
MEGYYLRKKIRLVVKYVLISILCVPIIGNSQSNYNILNFGAKADGRTINTQAINRTIQEAYLKGGGTVIIPRGKFITGTIFLASNVNILLEKDAYLMGSSNINDYRSFIPSKDLTKYSTISDQGNNSNSAYDSIWTKALIIGNEVQNITLLGEGVIDGQHVFNGRGEEGMRGAHTILLSNSRRQMCTQNTNIVFIDYICLCQSILYPIL